MGVYGMARRVRDRTKVGASRVGTVPRPLQRAYLKVMIGQGADGAQLRPQLALPLLPTGSGTYIGSLRSVRKNQQTHATYTK